MRKWREVALSELADIRVSNVDKKAFISEKPVLLCNYMDVYSNDYVRADIAFMEATATIAEISRFKVERGDVLITKDSETPDDIGIPAVVMDEVDSLVCGYHLALIKPKRELVDSVYLCKQLATDRTARYFGRYAAGSTRYGLSNGAIARTRISIPPLAAQRKIAAILTGIDTVIEKTEALIAKYQHIKAGLMHDLFTRGVLPNGQLRPPREQAPELYQETAIGWIPKEWRASTCGQSCVIDSGITLGPHRRPQKRAHPYLRVANVYRDELRLDDVATLELLPGEEAMALRKFDLLVVEGHANRAEIGRCAMVHDDAEGLLFQNHLFRIRATGLNPVYALLWMNSYYSQSYWERACATSSGLNTINRRMLKAMPFLVPSDAEQDQIAAAAQTAKDRIAKTLCQFEKLRQQKIGLMQDLLTGKVPVKVEEPAAEPAHA